MKLRMIGRSARAVAAGCFILASAAGLWADNVKLDRGGSLSGSVRSTSKTIAVRTSTGAVIVFDRSDVTQINHGRTPAAKPASNGASAKAQPPKKRKLTPEEEAWMPKVRSLVSRLYGSDRNKSAQAKNTLLNIDDTDAIPALSTYFGSSRDEQTRHLFVVVLHSMKGPKPVYYLVALSLYDESPQIRSEARKAIREDQLDSARILYMAALRTGHPHLTRVAAIAIGEIGDPRGDSIPYLINALVSYGTVATMTEPAQYGLLYTITFMATPGLNFSGMTFNIPNSGITYTGTGTSPMYLTPVGVAEAQAALKKVTGPGQSLGIGGTIYLQAPGFFPGGQFGKDFTPNSKGMPDVELKETLNPRSGPPPGSQMMGGDTYALPVIGMTSPSHEKRIRGLADHPEVLDALVKITDQKYPGHGFNQDRWRSWWATEKASREAQQKRAAQDRVIPNPNPAQ
jgi:hypothetical protein